MEKSGEREWRLHYFHASGGVPFIVVRARWLASFRSAPYLITPQGGGWLPGNGAWGNGLDASGGIA